MGGQEGRMVQPVLAGNLRTEISQYSIIQEEGCMEGHTLDSQVDQQVKLR